MKTRKTRKTMRRRQKTTPQNEGAWKGYIELLLKYILST